MKIDKFRRNLSVFIGIYRYLSVFVRNCRKMSENVGICRQVRVCNVNFGLQDLNSSFASDVTDASERETFWRLASASVSASVRRFGDFPVSRAGRGHRKRWVLIVTCLVTRAIALFPLPDMTLSSVVHALSKMNAQFPSLRKMYSNKGSNFRARIGK